MRVRVCCLMLSLQLSSCCFPQRIYVCTCVSVCVWVCRCVQLCRCVCVCLASCFLCRCFPTVSHCKIAANMCAHARACAFIREHARVKHSMFCKLLQMYVRKCISLSLCLFHCLSHSRCLALSPTPSLHSFFISLSLSLSFKCSNVHKYE